MVCIKRTPVKFTPMQFTDFYSSEYRGEVKDAESDPGLLVPTRSTYLCTI